MRGGRRRANKIEVPADGLPVPLAAAPCLGRTPQSRVTGPVGEPFVRQGRMINSLYLLVVKRLLGREVKCPDKATAERIARAHCNTHQLNWIEPVVITDDITEWYVMTNARCRGGNVNIRILKRTGEVT